MIEVEITRGEQTPRRVRLADGAFRIGRHEDNDIVLDGQEVSRYHARLLLDGPDVAVEDLSSGNGILIGGRTLREGLVREGEVVEIATFSLSFQHVVPEVDGVAMLLALDGDDVGRRWTLDKDALVLGRGVDAHIHIDDPGVSRHHAQLLKRTYGWAIRDNGSANGMYLNDQRLREAPLRSGDIIRLGPLRFRFVIKEGETDSQGPTKQGEATVILRREELFQGADLEELAEAAAAPTPVAAPASRVAAETAGTAWWAYLLLGMGGAAILLGLLWYAGALG